MATSAEYASTADYAVLTNRFKLLNLVQRVAHRDVMEMIATVGLDAVTSKGTLSRWQPGSPNRFEVAPARSERRAKASPTSRPPTAKAAPEPQSAAAQPRFVFTRGGSRQDAKAAAARSAAPNTSTDAPAQSERPRRYVVRRTASEEEAFYDRLAAPRERPEDVFIERVEVLEQSAPPPPRAVRRGPRRVHYPPPRGGWPRGAGAAGPESRELYRDSPYMSYDGYPVSGDPAFSPYPHDPRYAYDMYDDGRTQPPPPPPPLPRPPQLSDVDDSEAMRFEAQPRRVRFRDDDEDADFTPTQTVDVSTGPDPLHAPAQSLSTEVPTRVPLLPPTTATDSEGSAPEEVRGTAPRNKSFAATDATAPTPPPPAVPSLHLPTLESAQPQSSMSLSRENEDMTAAESESTGGPVMSSTSGALTPRGGTRRQRTGGPMAKAKPRAAHDSPRVPMEAIHHAASALLAQSNMARSQVAVHNSYQRPGGEDGLADGYHTTPLPDRRGSVPGAADTARASQSAGNAAYLQTGGSPSHGSLPSVAFPVPVYPITPLDAGVATPVATTRGPRPPPATFAEVASTIDHMLLDHQRILSELVRPDRDSASNSASSNTGSDIFTGDAAITTGVSLSDPRRRQAGHYTTLSLEQQRKIRQAHVLADDAYGDGVHLSVDDEDDDVADEMLLHSRLQRKVASMDADLARIQRTQEAEQQLDARAAQRAAGSISSGVGNNNAAESRQESHVAAPRRRRPAAERGTMPDAAIRRLHAFRKENYEYIAYNEKLWNTSQVSQFAFAQRLTNALAEDCFNEVMQEVGDIMDDYVEGLADHELR